MVSTTSIQIFFTLFTIVSADHLVKKSDYTGGSCSNSVSSSTYECSPGVFKCLNSGEGRSTAVMCNFCNSTSPWEFKYYDTVTDCSGDTSQTWLGNSTTCSIAGDYSFKVECGVHIEKSSANIIDIFTLSLVLTSIILF